MDVLIYFGAIGLWSFSLTYLFLFGFRSAVHHARPHAAHHHAAPVARSKTYSRHEGFKSFARGAELTTDDIVKGLSRD